MTLPGRGETVGEAFIRIRADGSGLDESIRREWDKHDEVIRSASKRDAKKYADEVDKEMRSGTSRKKLRNALKDAFISGAATDEFLKSPKWRDFRKKLEKDYGDAGRLAGKRLGDGIAQGASFDSLNARLKNVRREVASATKDILARQEAGIAARARAEEKLGRLQAAGIAEDIRRDRHATDERIREGQRLTNALERLTRKRFDAISKLSTGVASRDRRDLEKTLLRLGPALARGDRDALNALRDIHKETKLFIKDGEHGFLRLNGRIRESVRDMTDSERRLAQLEQRIRGLNLGKLFGAGARNNFFNALGLAVGGLAEGIALAGIRARRVFADIRGDLGATERGVKGLAQKVEVLGATLFRAFGKVALLPVGLFGALNALSLIAGPLAAALSLLSGVIVALISTIGLGLVGAIAAVLPVAGVFAIGIGVMSVALGHLNKAQKEVLKQRLGPVVKDFRELRSATRNALFSDLPKQVPLLHRLLENQIKPLFSRVGRAISRSWTDSLKVLNGKTMEKNFISLRSFAPSAIGKLGRILTNTFVSLSGVLRAAVPVATRFLDSLVKSSARMSRIINSGKGQNHLQVFFINAYDSARRLWRFLKDLGKVLLDILKGGQSTGDTIFDSMSKSLERFDKFLRSGKGRLALTKWFQASRSFLTSLGKFVGGVAHLFNALDSSTSRGILKALLNGLGNLFDFIANLLPNIQHFQQELGRLLKPILKLLEPIAKILLGALANGARILSTLITPLANGLSDLVRALGPLKGVLAGLLGPLAAFVIAAKGLKLIGLGSLLTAFGGTTLGTRIGLWGLSLQSALGRVTARITSAKFGLARVIGGLGLVLSGKTLAGAAGGLNTTGGKLTDAAANIFGGALAGSVFGPWGTAIGALGGSIKTVIDLFQSSGDAAKAASDKAIAAMAAEKQAVNDLADSISSLGLKAAIQQNVLTGLRAPQSVDFRKGGKQALSLFDVGDQLGINPRQLNQAALGNTGDRTKFETALQKAIGTPAKPGFLSESNWESLNKALDDVTFKGRQAEKVFEQESVATGNLRFTLIPLTKEVKRYGSTLDASTAFGQRNRFVIRQQAKALFDHAQATRKSGKAAILAAGQFLINERNLRRAAIAAGFDKDTVDKLTAAYQKLPSRLTTELKQIGVTPSQITAIIDKYGKIPKSLLTQITKKGVTPADIQRIIDKLLGIPKHPVINVDANIDRAIARINELKQILQAGGTFVVRGSGKHGLAAGGILNRTTFLTPHIFGGEAGPEAVVPLRRALSQVDPSVRALSAFAQGLDNGPTGLRNGGVIGNSKTVNVQAGAITVVTPSTDPVAVATEVMNRAVRLGGG